jgi:hypothetical protein
MMGLLCVTVNAQVKYIAEKNATILKTPMPLADNIGMLKSGDTIFLTSFIDQYWYITKGNLKGYVHELFIKTTSNNAYLRADYDKSHKKDIPEYVWHEYVWPTSVRIGMTKEELIHLIGKPTEINTSTGSWGIHEQLVYDKDGEKTKYYYIENGNLVSYQD